MAPAEEPAGSFAAVEGFIAARQHRLLRSAFLITGDLELAQDLLQDALIKLALNWAKIHTDPEAYLRTVLYRDAVSWWRRRRREFSTAVVPEQVAVDSADESAVRVAFGQALGRLTPKQRAGVGVHSCKITWGGAAPASPPLAAGGAMSTYGRAPLISCRR